MKCGEMQKKFFRFLDRLPYLPFYTESPIFKRRNFTQLWRASNKEKQCKIFLQIRNFFLQNFFNINVCP